MSTHGAHYGGNSGGSIGGEGLNYDGEECSAVPIRVLQNPNRVPHTNTSNIGSAVGASVYRERETPRVSEYPSLNEVYISSDQFRVSSVGDNTLTDSSCGRHLETNVMSSGQRNSVLSGIPNLPAETHATASRGDIEENMHISVDSFYPTSLEMVATFFGVEIKTPFDIDTFTKDLDNGKYEVWLELSQEQRVRVIDIVVTRLKELLVKKVDNVATNVTNLDDPIVHESVTLIADINSEFSSKMDALASYGTTMSGVANVSGKESSGATFRHLVSDPVFEGVNISIPRKVVEKVRTRLEYTLYGYFIGKRMAFPVVEYYVKNNWAKHGLTRIMMNSKGFFFFKFKTLAGLEAVLEEGPWLIRKSPIILKKWSIDTRLIKEELTCIPIWVKLHDVPIQVFEEDGLSLIASFIGKHVMLDSYTSSMCKESWGRSSFARCLIEVNSEVDFMDVVTIGVPTLTGEGFAKETIKVEYEWRPPRCVKCRIFGHTSDQCSNKVVSPPTVSTSYVVPSNAIVATSTVDASNDGFQMVGKKKKRKSKSKSTNGVKFTGPSVQPNVRFVPKATSSEPKKGGNSVGNASSYKMKEVCNSSKEGNLVTSNSYSALLNDDEEDDEDVEVVYDESANLFPNLKAGESSSFTVAAG